jgi:hypothetical protein
MRRLLWTMMLCAGFAAVCGAAEPDKSSCNRKSVGKYWPDRANADRSQIWHFVQTGELRVCAEAGWHYRWESLTVNVHDLERDSLKKSQAGRRQAGEDRASNGMRAEVDVASATE